MNLHIWVSLLISHFDKMTLLAWTWSKSKHMFPSTVDCSGEIRSRWLSCNKKVQKHKMIILQQHTFFSYWFFPHEFHETCHSVTFYFMKKDSKWCCETPLGQSQFTPKMKTNAVPRLLSSLVWIDQYNECNGMTSFMEFIILHKTNICNIILKVL